MSKFVPHPWHGIYLSVYRLLFYDVLLYNKFIIVTLLINKGGINEYFTCRR